MRHQSAFARLAAARRPDPRRDGPTPGGRAVPALLLAALAALAGCSRQAWYEAGQVNAELRCRQGPAAAYDDCMSRLNEKPYADYRREREAARQAP